MTCHHFEGPDTDDPYDRTSLHYVASKYPPGSLARFLQQPARFHPATAMPDFGLGSEEAKGLEQLIRQRADGRVVRSGSLGDPIRGRELFRVKGCVNCHTAGEVSRKKLELPLVGDDPTRSCIHPDPRPDDGTARSATSPPVQVAVGFRRPTYALAEDQRSALKMFLDDGRKSLSRLDRSETAQRLFRRLSCGNCHDRDGDRSHRQLVIAEEGGSLAEPLPDLTWAGEKFNASWTRSLLAGTLDAKMRPWVAAKMPSFAAYSEMLSDGFAEQHGIDPRETTEMALDESMVSIGQQLTLQTGLDCRQCHGIGNQQPRGDKDTQVALGINFEHIRDRMRHEAYQRFMLDPPRYDPKTRMIRLSSDGVTTKLKQYFDADARMQFEAIWHYIQSLPVTNDQR